MPSTVVKVIVALPVRCAITLPKESTLATDGSLDEYVTFLLVASAGIIFAVIACVEPGDSERVLFSIPITLIDSTGTVASITSIVIIELLPVNDLTVISALPTFKAVATPLLIVTTS